jgi:hypothetical protein
MRPYPDLSVLCAAVVDSLVVLSNHRDTENTKVAQRRTTQETSVTGFCPGVCPIENATKSGDLMAFLESDFATVINKLSQILLASE